MASSRAARLSFLVGLLGAGLCGACSPTPAPHAAVVDVKPVAHAPADRADEAETEPERRTRLPPMDAAERLVAEGRVYAQRGEYPAALNRFEAAYRISPSDDLLYDIGRALELTGRRREAADVYERYLQSDLSHTDRMSMELRILQLRGAQPPHGPQPPQGP